MSIEEYQEDIDFILSKRFQLGWDFWTTSDKRLIKGGVFSNYNSTLVLLELGMKPSDPLLQDVSKLWLETWREDGRFKLYPQGGIYPCQTIAAANILCHLDYATDSRLKKTFEHLLNSQNSDGGWRCNKFSFGRGPETDYSNPGPTLIALDAFRFTSFLNQEPALDKAVEFLLNHWLIRKPIGPCHYGIGTLFMQIEYPFGNYNLFNYVYILSFYNYAKQDQRFLEALHILESKLAEGNIVPERVDRKLAKLSFCKKGEISKLATKRYQEILHNLKQS